MKNHCIVFLHLIIVQTVTGAPLGEMLKELRPSFEKKGFSGVITVNSKDCTLFEMAAGFANQEQKELNTLKTQFLIGSITKEFTAAAILLLAQQGRLDLQKTISSYIPVGHELWGGKTPEWADKITIAHLLSHSSGLPEYIALPQFKEFYKSLRTAKDFLELLHNHPLHFIPGSQYEYSGSGYNLLGVIIEVVTGKPYGVYLKEQFFDPLKMSATFSPHKDFLSAVRPHHKNIAMGYFVSDDKKGFDPAADINMSSAFAEGSIISTARDLHIWRKALFQHKIVNEQFLKLMITPHFKLSGGEGVGYGIFISNDYPFHLYGNSGKISGFHGYLGYIPGCDIMIVMLSNVYDGFFPLAEILDTINESQKQVSLSKKP